MQIFTKSYVAMLYNDKLIRMGDLHFYKLIRSLAKYRLKTYRNVNYQSK